MYRVLPSLQYNTLREPSGIEKLNFPSSIPNYGSVMHISPQVGESDKFLLVESVIRNPGLQWNPGIQLNEFGIPLTIGIQNPSSTDRYWNPVPGVRNPYRGIQNPTVFDSLIWSEI